MMRPQASAVSSVTQRWERPEIYSVEPGHWKKQLAGKYLSVATKGDVPALKTLLKDHPEFLNKRGNHGRTLLWEATRSGRLTAVKFLVERGADVNLTGCYNSETHVQVTPYCAARYYRRNDIAEYLWTNGSKLDVFRAAFLGEQARVEKHLAKNPELLNAEDPGDEIYFIPLVSFAVAAGHADLTGFLIDQGANIAPYSAQLIYLAAKASRMDLVELLTAHGADVRAMDSSSFVAVNDLDLMRYLLEQGAPVNQMGKNGFPPLIFLARGDKSERPDKLALLLDFGADVNAVGPKGKTALHYAATGGHSGLVKLLLDRGADATLKDDDSETALDLARATGKTATAALLVVAR
jgi:ankyrin repeat protein